MEKHTPGPWHHKVDANPVPFRRQTRYGHTEIWPKDQRYGKVVLQVGGDTPEMKMANARLIAVAPDLLEVVKQILYITGTDTEGADNAIASKVFKQGTTDWAELSDCFAILRAAIARATGQEVR